jgi:hypothetical protein
MDKLRSLSALAALCLASAAFGQNQASPNPADAQAIPQTAPSPDPNAASSPHQRDVTSQPGAETAPTASPDPDAAASPHQEGVIGSAPKAGLAANTPRIVGLQVVSPAGEQLGSVIDVVPNEKGEPAYAIVSTGADTATAVPYASVSPMVRDNKVVFDRHRLENSPQVAQTDLQDKANSKWRLQADRYWGAATIRSASPGRAPTPVDR